MLSLFLRPQRDGFLLVPGETHEQDRVHIVFGIPDCERPQILQEAQSVEGCFRSRRSTWATTPLLLAPRKKSGLVSGLLSSRNPRHLCKDNPMLSAFGWAPDT